MENKTLTLDKFRGNLRKNRERRAEKGSFRNIHSFTGPERYSVNGRIYSPHQLLELAKELVLYGGLPMFNRRALGKIVQDLSDPDAPVDFIACATKLESHLKIKGRLDEQRLEGVYRPLKEGNLVHQRYAIRIANAALGRGFTAKMPEPLDFLVLRAENIRGDGHVKLPGHYLSTPDINGDIERYRRGFDALEIFLDAADPAKYVILGFNRLRMKRPSLSA